MAKTFKTMALLEQAFIKDTDKDVASVIKEATAALGEKIQVRRFEKYALMPLKTPPAWGLEPHYHPPACCPKCGFAFVTKKTAVARGKTIGFCRTEGCAYLHCLQSACSYNMPVPWMTRRLAQTQDQMV